MRTDAVIFERAEEGERPRDIIICDDERIFEAIVTIEPHFTDFAKNSFVLPSFDRAAKIHADDFAEHSSVHSFGVVSAYFQIIVHEIIASFAYSEEFRLAFSTRATMVADPGRRLQRVFR